MILLDETALNDALKAKAEGTASRRNTHEYLMDYHEHSYDNRSAASADYLLDEGALNRALQTKAENHRSRVVQEESAVPSKQTRRSSKKMRNLPRRRKSHTKQPSNSNLQNKRPSLKSENSLNSSSYANSAHPSLTTATTKSVASSNSSRPGGRANRTENKPSRRSKSEPRKRRSSNQQKALPIFHVTTFAEQDHISNHSYDDSYSSLEDTTTIGSNSDKGSFFKKSLNPTSVIQPSRDIVDPFAGIYTDSMGGAEHVEKIAARFFVIAKTVRDIAPVINGTSLHQVRDEFITLGNMEMSDDMELIRGMLEFHFKLVENGIDIDRVLGIWVDAYEAIWLSSVTDDSRSIAGPARAVFNLRAISQLYEQSQNDLRWKRRMEDDERRIEEQQEMRRKRREFIKEKRKRRRAKSLDRAFFRRQGSSSRSSIVHV